VKCRRNAYENLSNSHVFRFRIEEWHFCCCYELTKAINFYPLFTHCREGVKIGQWWSHLLSFVCCFSFRHLRFVSKEAVLSSDLPMSPNDFKTFVKDRCKELSNLLQKRSLFVFFFDTFTSFLDTKHRGLMHRIMCLFFFSRQASTKLYCLVTEAQRCK